LKTPELSEIALKNKLKKTLTGFNGLKEELLKLPEEPKLLTIKDVTPMVYSLDH